MKVQINGEVRNIEEGTTLAELITELGLPGRRIAVERNREVARRSSWDETIVSANDRIEIVHFVGGG